MVMRDGLVSQIHVHADEFALHFLDEWSVYSEFPPSLQWITNPEVVRFNILAIFAIGFLGRSENDVSRKKKKIFRLWSLPTHSKGELPLIRCLRCVSLV